MNQRSDNKWNNSKNDPLVEAVNMSALYQPPQINKETWEKTAKQALANKRSPKPLYGQYLRQGDEISTNSF